jgi:endonuclease/exonuclease/phosphatase family metal-dependent hydrolase
MLLINAAVIMATLLAYLAPVVDPKITWIVSFFGLFYPVFLILNALFILFWIVQKPVWLLPSLIAILVGWTHLEGFIGFDNTIINDETEGILLLTNNISNASFGYDKDKNKRATKKTNLENFLGKYKNTDILCFQEVGEYAKGILNQVFQKHKMYHTGKGAVIMSRHPIIDKGEIDFGTITNSCLWADIKVNGEIIRVYSIHLQSNRITNEAEEIAEKMELKEKKTWTGIRGILRKYKNHHIDRSTQAEQIAAHAAESPYPVVLTGDFNDPPQSYTYHVLSRKRTDAFKAKGGGLGTTYAGVIPFLRIDYVLADESIEINKCKLIKANFSDHHPIQVAFNVKKSKT